MALSEGGSAWRTYTHKKSAEKRDILTRAMALGATMVTFCGSSVPGIAAAEDSEVIRLRHHFAPSGSSATWIRCLVGVCCASAGKTPPLSAVAPLLAFGGLPASSATQYFASRPRLWTGEQPRRGQGNADR